jgi:hypothetical protein
LLDEDRRPLEQPWHEPVIIGNEDYVIALGILETRIPVWEQADIRFLADDSQSCVAKASQNADGIVRRGVIRDKDLEMGVGL